MPLDLVATAGFTGDRKTLALLAAMAVDPAVTALYERLDALAGAPVDDPRTALLAADLAAAVPQELLAEIPRTPVAVIGLKEALLAEYTPAQAEVVSWRVATLVERARG
ncbi:hypothetical protein ACFV3T_02415 [Streptomyces albidoflavus]